MVLPSSVLPVTRMSRKLSTWSATLQYFHSSPIIIFNLSLRAEINDTYLSLWLPVARISSTDIEIRTNLPPSEYL